MPGMAEGYRGEDQAQGNVSNIHNIEACPLTDHIPSPGGGFVSLATITSLDSRTILSRRISLDMEADFCIQVLRMLVWESEWMAVAAGGAGFTLFFQDAV